MARCAEFSVLSKQKVNYSSAVRGNKIASLFFEQIMCNNYRSYISDDLDYIKVVNVTQYSYKRCYRKSRSYECEVKKIVEYTHQNEITRHTASLCWMHWDCELNVVIMFHMPSARDYISKALTISLVSKATTFICSILSCTITTSRGFFTCGSNSFRPHKENSWKRSDFMVDVHAIFFSSLILNIFWFAFIVASYLVWHQHFSRFTALHHRLI